MLGIRNECTGPSAWQVPVRRTWRAAHLGLCAAIQGHDLHRALLLHQPARRSGQVHVYVAAAGPKVPLPHGAGLVAHKHQVVAHAHVHDALLDVRREALEGPACMAARMQKWQACQARPPPKQPHETGLVVLSEHCLLWEEAGPVCQQGDSVMRVPHSISCPAHVVIRYSG